MKIHPNLAFIKPAANAPGVALPKTAAAAGAASAPAALAPASQARLAASTTGDFDAARVAEIRDSIRAGRYQIDSAKIADGLLSTVHDLLGKKIS